MSLPENFAMEVMSARSPFGKINDPSRTRQAFQCMFDIHQPQVSLGGHWHDEIDYEYQGTRFLCSKELEYHDLQIEEDGTISVDGF